MTKPIARELPDSGKWTYEAKLDGLPAHGHRMIYLVESSVHVLSLLMSTIVTSGGQFRPPFLNIELTKHLTRP